MFAAAGNWPSWQKQQSVQSLLSYLPHNPRENHRSFHLVTGAGERVSDEQSSFIHTSFLSNSSQLHIHSKFLTTGEVALVAKVSLFYSSHLRALQESASISNRLGISFFIQTK